MSLKEGTPSLVSEQPAKPWMSCGSIQERTSSVASRELIVLIDDLDGQEITQGGETVRFGLDGVAYEIDLSAEHATGLREALQPYTARGRRVGGRQHVVGGGVTRADPEQLRAARRWLRGRGHEVSDKGRIRGELMELYLAQAGAR